MKKPVHQLILAISLFLVPVAINAQFIIIEKPDTSDYISGDPDFNLLVAADKGRLDDVKSFIRKGADINTTTFDGVTPLMYAAQKGHHEVAEYLIEQGAKLEMEPQDGLTALLGATVFNQIEIAELLIRKGADINKGDASGVTPLMYAAGYGYFVMADMLLYYDAALETEDKNGNTALMHAVYAGNSSIALLLLQNGAKPDHADHKGNTPLLIATQQNFDDIVSILLDFNADVNLSNNSGVNPLAQAVRNNNIIITKQLLRKGADVNTRITYAETPYTIAKSNHNDSIKELLLEHGAKKNMYPSINEWQLGAQTSFSADDFYLGLNLRFYERKYKFNLTADWLIRPFRTRVLVEEESALFYQFWELRNIFMAGLEKPFFLFSPEFDREIFLSVGASGAFAFVDYKGYIQDPDPRLSLVPSLGIISQRSRTSTKFNYAYMDLDLEGFSPHFFNLQFNIRFDLEQSKFKRKQVNWINQ